MSGLGACAECSFFIFLSVVIHRERVFSLKSSVVVISLWWYACFLCVSVCVLGGGVVRIFLCIAAEKEVRVCTATRAFIISPPPLPVMLPVITVIKSLA